MTEDWSGWCREMFRVLNVGGVWGVPRSGLTFTKVSVDPDVLRLTDRMPWTAALGGRASDWAAFQDDDFEVIREQFATAGITVERT